MKITVIICTYNRCQSLSAALDSVALSRLPESTDWEVLVVDNNSRDRTRDIVEDFCRKYPRRFRYRFEPKQGKSYALNAGIEEAQGEVLAFMDDDVIVEPTWLHNLTAPLFDSAWVGSGGRILPQGNFSPPPWFPINDRVALAALALFDLGTDAAPLTETPFGTNMAFRKEMFEKYGAFRTDLGPCPDGEIRGEDSEFARRLLNAGEPLRYEPSAIVLHEMHPHRINKQYLLAWSYAKGRSDVREFGLPSGAKWFVAGVPLRMLLRFARWTLKWTISFNPSDRFECELKARQVAGSIIECYRVSLEAMEKQESTAQRQSN